MGSIDIITDRSGQKIGAEYTPTIPKRQAPYFEGNVFEQDGSMSAIFLTAADAPYVIVAHAAIKTNETIRATLEEMGVPQDMIRLAIERPSTRLYGKQENWRSNNELRWENKRVPEPVRLGVTLV